MFYWLLKWVLLGPLLKLIFRPWAEGTENVPEEGGAILASNHLSYSDWLFMPLTIPRRWPSGVLASGAVQGPGNSCRESGAARAASRHCVAALM